MWSGPQLPGASGSLSGALPSGVDQRVVNAVAWVSSESAEDGAWLRQRIDTLEAAELAACLRDGGISTRLLTSAARERAAAAVRKVSVRFPNAQQVEDEGLWPEAAPDPESAWSTDEREAVVTCRRTNPGLPSAQARAADSSLRTAFDRLADSRPDPELSHAVEQFTACLVDRGYDEDVAGSPEAFVAWARTNRATDDPTGLELGVDYVTCGDPVWRARARARAAVRLAFVDAHESELRMLSEIVNGSDAT